MNPFDHMIENDLWAYSASTWHGEPVRVHYHFFSSIGLRSGHFKYNNEHFFVDRSEGRRGMGGMDEGSPPTYYIWRMK